MSSRAPARWIIASVCLLFMVTAYLHASAASQDDERAARRQDAGEQQKADDGEAEKDAEKDAEKRDVVGETLKQQSKILERRMRLRITDMATTLDLDDGRVTRLEEGVAPLVEKALAEWSRSGPGSQVLAWGGAPKPPAAIVLELEEWARLLEEVLSEEERSRYAAEVEKRRRRLITVRIELMIARLDEELLLTDEQREALVPVFEKAFTRLSKSRSARWRTHLLDRRAELADILTERQFAALAKRGR